MTPEATDAAAARHLVLRLRPLSRPARPARRPDTASPPTTARNCRAPGRPRQGGRGRDRRRRLGRRSRRLRHGGRRLRGDRGRARPHGAPSTSSVVPGVTAMLAVAARIGAPLGHDFCAISLSDNLKPWDVIEKRLQAAAQRRLRHRALQPDQQGAPLAARPRLRRAARRPAGRQRRHLRPRRRPARRAHRRPARLAEADPAHGRHGDLRHHRLGRDPHHRARRQAGAGLHAALLLREPAR